MALPLRSQVVILFLTSFRRSFQQVSQDGKALGGKITRPYQTKSFFRVPDVKARPALGSIQNTLPEKALHNVVFFLTALVYFFINFFLSFSGDET